MKILGLAGYARSGKDTAANALAELGWKRIAFADVLREFAYRLNPVIISEFGGYTPLQWIIDEYGWNGYKRTQWNDGVRDLLQILGTECGRELIGSNVWVDATLNNLPDGKYVISDVRFPNEAKAIWDRGGHVYRVWRSDVKPANAHSSETAMDEVPLNGVIENNGTVDNLRTNIISLVNGLTF